MGMDKAVTASRISISNDRSKIRREFPEKRAIIPASRLRFAPLEEAFLLLLSSEDFLLMSHQCKIISDK
jgi:hypothetical protein